MLDCINLSCLQLEKLCSKLSAFNPAPLSLSCAHSHQPRVTLSATQGRQSEHDAKTGRKSRVASGSPKESEDLGMESIKGKPELVCNTRPRSAPPPRLCARREPGQKENASGATGSFCKPCSLPENTAAWPGTPRGSGRSGEPCTCLPGVGWRGEPPRARSCGLATYPEGA